MSTAETTTVAVTMFQPMAVRLVSKVVAVMRETLNMAKMKVTT